MSPRRLLLTTAAMGGVGVLLRALLPSRSQLVLALTDPQRLADTGGADTVVVCLAGVLAGLVWCWGALGLLLTAAGTLPGLAGALGRALTRRLLPRGAQRAAALALGVGLNATLMTGTALAGPAPPAPVPDWPAASTSAPAPPPVPDWPAPRTAGVHRVRPGECLWDIADERLRAGTGRDPTNAEIAAAVHAWWRTNASVIGPDPDLLLPGQVLHPPAAP
jgi:hypothetical protein